MQGKYLLKKYIFKKDIFEYIFHMRKYKRLYFTCENIEYNLITSAFTVDFPQPTLDVLTL